MKVRSLKALIDPAAVVALVLPPLLIPQIKDLHHQDLAVLAVKVQSPSAAVKVAVMLTATVTAVPPQQTI